MTQIREIYIRLFVQVDAATSLLLKQDLIDAEFIKAENHRIFTKLNAVQDAATLRSSSQLSIQEAEPHPSYKLDVPIEPTSLGYNDDSSSTSQRPLAYVSDDCEDALDEPTPSSTNSPRTPSNAPTDRDIPYNETLRVRSDSFDMLDLSPDEVSEQPLTDKQHSPRRESYSTYQLGASTAGPVVSDVLPNLCQSAGSASSGSLRLDHSGPYFPSQGNIVNPETRDHQVGYSIYVLADNLNHSHAGLRSVSESVNSTPSLAQDPQDLPPRISHPSYPNYPSGGQSVCASPSSDREGKNLALFQIAPIIGKTLDSE
jgi:hypothetical protein